MNNLSVLFDGVELSDYLIVNDVQRDIGTEITNKTIKVGNRDGEIYSGSVKEKKIIPMTVTLIFDVTVKRRKLAHLLDTNEPKQLIFGDEPDKYYMAKIDGKTSLEEIVNHGIGTINWLVPDGVAHAIEEKEYTNQQEVTHTCDLKNKIAGSDVENPHSFYAAGDTKDLLPPNSNQWINVSGAHYKSLDTLDNKLMSWSRNTSGSQNQGLAKWDLVTDIDRRHPGLFESYGATTTAQKVAVARVIVKSLYAHTLGYGSGATGKGLTISAWDGQWRGSHTNKTDKIVDLFYKDWDNPTAINRFITEDGEVIIIAYAPASDGVTPSVVNLDYVSLEYTLAYADNSINIDNNGTYKTYPILETTMQSDNGLVAFINSNGALLQFGNPDEVDSVGYQESDWVVNDRLFTQAEVEKAGWKVNDVTFPDKLMGKYTLTPNGTIKYKTAEGVPLATAANWGTSSEYHGVTLSRDISPDSQGYVGAKNFEVRFSLYFITGQLNQTGLALVELRDKNDKQVCSISFVKNASTNNVGTIRLNVRGNVFYEQRYETNMWNIYTNINTEFSIVKHGNEFNFHLGGIKNGGFIKTYRDDTQTETEVTKIVWFGGIFGANSSPMENSIRSVTMQKHNVDKLRDIPNQFGKGDVLRVDPSSGTVYINGLETYGWALGNDYERFVLEPGENTIRCLVSSWVKQENMPKIKVINREAYL